MDLQSLNHQWRRDTLTTVLTVIGVTGGVIAGLLVLYDMPMLPYYLVMIPAMALWYTSPLWLAAVGGVVFAVLAVRGFMDFQTSSPRGENFGKRIYSDEGEKVGIALLVVFGLTLLVLGLYYGIWLTAPLVGAGGLGLYVWRERDRAVGARVRTDYAMHKALTEDFAAYFDCLRRRLDGYEGSPMFEPGEYQQIRDILGSITHSDHPGTHVQPSHFSEWTIEQLHSRRLEVLANAHDFYGDTLVGLAAWEGNWFADKHAKALAAADARFIEEVKSSGSVILGYPESVSGVFDATGWRPVTITPEELTRHGYLRGKTGAGKSTTMQFRLTQMFHIPNRGVIVVSPEQSLFKTRLVPYIPTSRFEDVLYINPNDQEGAVIGCNPLILHTDEDYLKKRQQLTVSFERALGAFGVSMTPLFSNSVGALLLRPHSSVLDLKPLFNKNDDRLRREIIRSSAIPENTREFWVEYEDSSYYDGAVSAMKNRLDPFLEEPLRTFFTTDAFDWYAQLNGHSRLVFIDTSGFAEGSDAGNAAVQIILGQLMYTFTRRDPWTDEERARFPYSMFVDEFWQYTSGDPKSWEGLFNQGRKYCIDITPAHQVSDNINKNIIGVIMKNAGTLHALELSRADSALFAAEMRLRNMEGKPVLDGFMDFEPGHGAIKTPKLRRAVPIYVPREQIVPRNPDADYDTLVALSKKNYGKKPEPPEPTAVIDDPPPPPLPKKPRERRKPPPSTPQWDFET